MVSCWRGGRAWTFAFGFARPTTLFVDDNNAARLPNYSTYTDSTVVIPPTEHTFCSAQQSSTMPPRKAVYGKPSHLYSTFSSFQSPVKSRKQETTSFEVVEVAEELSRLTVQTNFPTNHDENSLEREPLGDRIANTERPVKLARHRTTSSESVTSTASVETRQPKPAPVDTLETALAALEITKPHISNVFTKHASSLLALSSQGLTCFSSWSDQLSSHFAVTKIAEASFGEVYRLSLLKAHSALSNTDESVLKIIALKPPASVKRKMTKAAKKRTDMMSDPVDVAAEVRLMQRMTCTPGFTNFREICVLQGRPGDAFAKAWSAWNDSQETQGKEVSVFPDPSIKASYSEDQLWAVIEMQDAGTDLEKTKVANVWLAWDIFWGVVLALGKGEEAARFEHRDLHMGNICVSGLQNAAHCCEPDYVPTRSNKKLNFTGIETTLIDYTISRAEMGDCTSVQGEEEVAYLDLERDLTLFEGDAEEEYQYEIYRYMRSAMYLGEPLGDLWERWDEGEASGRTWKGYHPQTNLVWLHYVLHQLGEQIAWPSAGNGGTQGGQAAVQRAKELEAGLVRVSQLLEPEEMAHSGLRSASDLVVLALNEGWLDKEDVQGRVSATGRMGKTTKRKAKTSRR
jgi:serine/threonine-protein kinase haspin